MNTMIQSLRGISVSALALISLATPQGMFAETPSSAPVPSSVQQYIRTLPDLQQSAGGALIVPPAVLGSARDGQLSSIMQLVIKAHLLSQCTKRVVAAAPARRDPYVKAKAAYDRGLCQISQCFQQTMLIDYLMQMGQMNQLYDTAVAQQSRQAAQQQASQLIAKIKAQTCGGSGSTIDPNLIAMLSQLQ